MAKIPWAMAVGGAVVAAVLVGCTNPDATPNPAISHPSSARAVMAQGEPAVFGYFYVIQLTGFAPNADVTVSCRDTADAGGFRTFVLRTDDSGNAISTDGCYSGEGPEYWFVADGFESNHVRWTLPTGDVKSPDPRTSSPTVVVDHPPSQPGSVSLAQGTSAPFGYWYVVRLTGFPPNASVVVVCRDSVDPQGFKTFSMQVDAFGAATNRQACYSGDGPEHWVTANDAESNRVTWSVPSGSVSLTQGDAAPFGFWYVVTLSGFPANASVTVVCRDSVDPQGFKTLTMQVDASGTATNPQACYSGDGPEHWVSANGTDSNRLTWGAAS